MTFKVSHHEEARSEGTFLGVLCGGLHTLCLFNAKCHQQVNGVQAHGNNLTHVIFVIIPQIKHAQYDHTLQQLLPARIKKKQLNISLGMCRLTLVTEPRVTR